MREPIRTKAKASGAARAILYYLRLPCAWLLALSIAGCWPGDVESGVAGVPDKDGLIKPRAYVVLKDGYEGSDELVRELQAYVKNNTAPHKYPRSIAFVNDLPKTATGKIQRYKLRERGLSETHGSDE